MPGQHYHRIRYLGGGWSSVSGIVDFKPGINYLSAQVYERLRAATVSGPSGQINIFDFMLQNGFIEELEQAKPKAPEQPREKLPAGVEEQIDYEKLRDYARRNQKRGRPPE